MKPNTRVDDGGPWANVEIYQAASILPDELLLPWHLKYLELFDSYDDSPFEYRQIYNAVDTSGGKLKTAFTKRMIHYHGNDVSFLDCWSSPQQLQNSIVAEGPKKLYMFDIPCKFLQGTWNTEQVNKLASLIERVKDGGPFRATMYGGNKVLIFDPPIVLVFSNTPLDKSCFTPGRLVWDMLQPEDCVPIVPTSLEGS